MKNNNYKINKNRLYHKLINNKLVYDNKSLNRYKNDDNNISLMSANGKESLLSELKDRIKSIRNCELKKNATNLVFSDGNPFSKIMIIGEGPGANEDKEGKPFVGRAGKLLDKMLTAINRSRENDVFICNVLKCRPPDNRDPSKEEISKCEPYLVNQIDLIQPKLIVALGRVAGKTLLGVDKSLKDMRNTIHSYHGTNLIVTYHPAALLRNSNWKPDAWNDFKWIRTLID